MVLDEVTSTSGFPLVSCTLVLVRGAGAREGGMASVPLFRGRGGPVRGEKMPSPRLGVEFGRSADEAPSPLRRSASLDASSRDAATGAFKALGFFRAGVGR